MGEGEGELGTELSLLPKKSLRFWRSGLSGHIPIFVKIYRFCQLSSRGFFARVWIFKSIGPSLWISLAQKTQSYDTNMLPKVVFDKTGLSMPIDFKNLKKTIC